MAFSGRTRRIVAARAGYRCSFPQCNAITIGPNRSGGFIITGEAAHIHSPKPKGPRASTEYSDEYLDAPENGIWLCRKHHKAVDSTSGSDYPPSLLASYKDLHEQKIAYALLGVETNITWLQTLRIERHYFLTAGAEINFAKLNLLSGRVGVGKSTLCRLIVAAFSDLHPHEKLSREPAATYEIELFDSEPKTLRIETQPSRKLFTLNGEQHFLCPVPLEVVYPGKATSRTEDGILPLLASVFGRSPELLGAILRSDDTQRIESLVRWRPCVSGDTIGLEVDVRNNNDYTDFGMLSVGEQGLTILSIAYQICCLLSRRRSVLQVIDNQFVTSLDHETLNRYLKFLSRPRQNFQTILVLQETSILSTLTDWRVFVMQPSKNGVEIVQDYGTGLARFA